MRLSKTVFTSSIYLDGAISTGRRYEVAKYNAKLLGLSANSIGIPPGPSTVVVDAVSTGTLTSPSWTHASVGFNQAFVGMSLSASFYEAKELNYYFSGTEVLEQTPAPVSAQLYYSKQTKLQTIIIKHTASFLDTVVPVGSQFSGVFNTYTPRSFFPGTGTLCYPNTNPNFGLPDVIGPTKFFLNVPQSGKLVDIKVWIEFVQASASGLIGNSPLANVAISLRSPNVSWNGALGFGHAHPILNNSTLINQIGNLNGVVFPNAELYANSFLLWEGRNQTPSAPFGLINWPGGGRVSDLPTWDYDRGMRVVFSDGGINNPRRLTLDVSTSGNFVGSPNSSGSTVTGSAWGAGVPWTSDVTAVSASHTASGSPPPGWLTGPGGVASVNEWPTTGVNYGANYLQPVYPLLDPILVKKRMTGVGFSYDDTGNYANPQVSMAQIPTPSAWLGARPGLRGSEISGTWVLMFSEIGYAWYDGNWAATGTIFFRQARLEITYETPQWTAPARVRRTSAGAQAIGETSYKYEISGTDTICCNFFDLQYEYPFNPIGGYFTSKTVTEVWVNPPPLAQVGRTFGVTYNTGSTGAGANWALLYRLSGTLAGISGSVPGWLTNADPSGMPSIPVSSASLAPPSNSSSIDSSLVASAATFISPPKTLDGARSLSLVAQDINPTKSLPQLAVDFVSGTTGG